MHAGPLTQPEIFRKTLAATNPFRAAAATHDYLIVPA